MDMEFIENVEKEEYEEFVQTHKKSHFLQSYDWGEFARLEKNFTPYYVGLKDNGKLVAAALLLQKKLPLGLSYFYSPRGFVIDFHDFSLLEKFTKEIKKMAKKKRAIFVKIDPDLIIHRENYLDEEQEPDYDSQKMLEELKKLGFKHLGFTKNFETMQPRYSFRIDMEKPMEDIYNCFSKTTKQRIKKAEELEVEVSIGTKEDISEFYRLMKLTEDRKDFVSHGIEYYQTLYDLFHPKDRCNLFIGKVDIAKILMKKKAELEPLSHEQEDLLAMAERSKSQNTKLKELERRTEKLKTDIEKFEELKTSFGDRVVVSGHFIIEYGDKAWVLYAGNHNILTDTYANYKTYFEHIQFYHNRVKTYDQFGTIGDLRKENPLLGLHEFKKKFGGDYVEFLGEFDLITNHFFYFLFQKLVPFYRKMMKTKAKKNHESK